MRILSERRTRKHRRKVLISLIDLRKDRCGVRSVTELWRGDADFNPIIGGGENSRVLSNMIFG